MTDQAPTTPDTVVVPVEPTEAMCMAGRGLIMAFRMGLPNYTTSLADVARSGFYGEHWAHVLTDEERTMTGPLTKGHAAHLLFRAMLAARPAATPGGEREVVARIIRENVKVDATGLAPAVASIFMAGIEDATDAILAALFRPAPVAGEAASIGRYITFSPEAADVGNAVVSPDEPDGPYWTLIAQGDEGEQNAIAAEIVRRLNTPTPEPAAARGGEDAWSMGARSHADRLVALLTPDQGESASEAFGLALRLQDAFSAKGGS